MTDEKLKELKEWVKDLVLKHDYAVMTTGLRGEYSRGQYNILQRVLEKLEELEKC